MAHDRQAPLAWRGTRIKLPDEIMFHMNNSLNDTVIWDREDDGIIQEPSLLMEEVKSIILMTFNLQGEPEGCYSYHFD